MEKDKVYTAIDLCDKAINFISMTPDSSEWNFDILKSNPPRFHILQEIEALIRAFNLNRKIEMNINDSKSVLFQEFISGDFVEKRKFKDYSNIVKFVKDFVNNNQLFYLNDSIHLHDIKFIFLRLIDFKKRLNKLSEFNSGYILVTSISDFFTIGITNSIMGKLKTETHDLNKILSLIIDPLSLSYNEEELMSKFNYPVYDERIYIEYL
jgi:hypothetical protein